MSIENIIRTIVREEVAALSVSVEPDGGEATPPKTTKAKGKGGKGKGGRKKPAAPAEPEEENTEPVPTDYEGFMARIKNADSEASTAPTLTWSSGVFLTRYLQPLQIDDSRQALTLSRRGSRAISTRACPPAFARTRAGHNALWLG